MCAPVKSSGLPGWRATVRANWLNVSPGCASATSGHILIADVDVANQPPLAAIMAGVAHIPEDRNRVGSSPNLTITDNVIMKNYRNEPIGNGLTIDDNTAQAYAQSLKETFDILAPSVQTLARKLSGGNLQKVILAREINTTPKVIVAVQPTRGLDVGAVEAIQRHLLAQRLAGAAILLMSEELEELFALSDRIAVIYGGEIMGIVEPEEFDIGEIGLMMTGTPRASLQSMPAASANP